MSWLDEQLGRLERTQFLLPYRRLKARIESLATDQRYNFMFGSLSVQALLFASQMRHALNRSHLIARF